MGGDQRAKVEEYDDNLLVVLRTLRYIERTSDIESGEVTVFVGDRFVVTVRRGDGNPLFGVRTRLEQHAEQLQLGPSAVLHAVMDLSLIHISTRAGREAVDSAGKRPTEWSPPG